jgi:hypothetical protein
MIYMKILKKGGGGEGNEIHAPCACGFFYWGILL